MTKLPSLAYTHASSEMQPDQRTDEGDYISKLVTSVSNPEPINRFKISS
jgi:hypothetical protein